MAAPHEFVYRIRADETGAACNEVAHSGIPPRSWSASGGVPLGSLARCLQRRGPRVLVTSKFAVVSAEFAGLPRANLYCTTEDEKTRDCFPSGSHKEHELPESDWGRRTFGIGMRRRRLLLLTRTKRGIGASVGCRPCGRFDERPAADFPAIEQPHAASSPPEKTERSRGRCGVAFAGRGSAGIYGECRELDDCGQSEISSGRAQRFFWEECVASASVRAYGKSAADGFRAG